MPIDFSGVLWWKATVEAERPFDYWVGAREAIWSRAGKLEWIRILDLTQSQNAERLAPELVAPLRCGPSQIVYEAPSKDALGYAVMGIRLSSTELPSLLLAFDLAAVREIRLENAGPVVTPMLESLLELELPLSVALGRTVMPVGEVLKITSGSVIFLEGHTGEQVDVLVHGTVVARGQVISSQGCYGVRIREILSPTQRIQLCAPEVP